MALEAYASTTDFDLDRVKMRGWAFGYPLLSRRELPPLYFKHDTSRPVGRIEELAYDDFGNLIIRATDGSVSQLYAKLDYMMHHLDSIKAYW